MRVLLLIFSIIKLSIEGFSQVSWSVANDNLEFSWNLLTITLGKSAWESKRRYMNTISVDKPVDPSHHLSVWNTWGNWKTGNHDIKPINSFAKKTGAEILVLDDPWESFHGSATYNTEKFPTFPQGIVHINELGMDHGIWETLARVDRPDELGLTNDDLLLDRNGNQWYF